MTSSFARFWTATALTTAIIVALVTWPLAGAALFALWGFLHAMTRVWRWAAEA